LIAKEGIGTSDTMISTDIAIIDVMNTDTGNIYINNASALTLADLNADGQAIQNSGGGQIVSAETLTIDAAINQREDFTLTGKSIALNASITHENQGTIRLSATESLSFDTNKITTTDGTITLETENAIVIEAGQIIPETGEMNIVATGDLKIDRFDTTANLQIENISGNIVIDLLQAENLTIDAQSIQFDEILAKAVTMKSTGAITETDDTETDMIAETIHLEAAEINLDIAGNAILTAIAQNNIDISAAGDLNASHVKSTSGSIKIQADGNIEIGQISAKDRVTIASNNILAAADGQISGQSAVIKSEDGIGSADNLLSLSVDQLDIANTNTGNIYIQNDKALTLMDMDNDSLAVENTGRTITIDDCKHRTNGWVFESIQIEYNINRQCHPDQ
jgi:hypothetical protein